MAHSSLSRATEEGFCVPAKFEAECAVIQRKGICSNGQNPFLWEALVSRPLQRVGGRSVFDTVLACDWGSNLPHRVIEPTRPCHQSVRPKLSCRRCRDVTSLQLKFRFRSDLIKSICTFGSAKSLLCRNASGQD